LAIGICITNATPVFILCKNKGKFFPPVPLPWGGTQKMEREGLNYRNNNYNTVNVLILK
jgi:hypothetical protein